MSQQFPPNNDGEVPLGHVPLGDGMIVPGGYADVTPGYAPSGYGSQEIGHVHYGGNDGVPSYGPKNYARHRAPIIDPIESAKLTPQLLVLLVLSGLKRHWKWSLPMGLILGLLVGGILYLAQPVQYEAAAQIQIRAVRIHLIDDSRPQGRYEDFVNTQLALLRSPSVIDRALENNVVARLPIILKQRDQRGWLTKNLLVSPVRRSEIVRVSIATDTEDASVTIVNAVIDAYFNYNEEMNRQMTQNLLTGLRTEERRLRSLAQTYQENIRGKTERAAAAGAAAGTEGMVTGLVQGESLQRDVAMAETQLTAMQAQRRSIQERIDQPGKVPLAMLMQGNPELISLSEQKDNLMRRKEMLTSTLKQQNDPRILQADREIEIVDKRIRDIIGGVDSTGQQSMQDYFRYQAEVDKYQNDQQIRYQEILVEALTKKYRDQLANSATRAADVLDVAFEQAQLQRINKGLDLIDDRILSVQTEQRAPAQIALLSRAVPSMPSLLRPIMLVGGGSVVFAFFPLLLSIAVERMKPRLYHVSQVRRAIPQVLIGEIMEPPVSWVHGAMFRKRLARYRESVHNWCTHLLLSDPFRSCKTLAVASVAGDDGKTFLAVQIAVAMAQMKEGRVLLVDGDMRVGRLHLLFGNEEAGVGLADVLSMRHRAGEAIVEDEKTPNLAFLSAGQLDISPYEILGDGRFREFLDAMEWSPSNPNGFSLVIVVIPPVANAAEALIMASSTDSTLLCVRQGETVLAAMEDVYRKLVNTGASVDGIVVKDIPYYQMAGRDGGFADRLEQIRLSHLLQYAD